MAYTPRKRSYRIRWKFAAPLLLLVSLCVYGIVSVLMQPEEVDERYAICNYTPDQTLKKLNRSFEETYTLSDYFYYGESLNLLHSPYNVETSDDVEGKTIELVDVCSKETYQLSMEGTIDRKVALDEIKPGFYEVYVVDQLERKRAVYTTELNDDHFTTITRNGKVKRIHLIANIDLLSDFDQKLKDRYLFIEVTAEKPAEDEYDIMIDPSEYNRDISNYVERGGEGNGVIEYEENFKAAELLKKELESYGLRVGLTRDNMEDVVNTYGRKGRLARAFNSNARYYFYLGFQDDLTSSSVKGMEIYYSSHSSPVLANAIDYHLRENTKLTGNPMYSEDGEQSSVIQLSQFTGKDGRTVYDNDMVVREAGGKATQAGMYSENTEKGTASFAKDNLYGMQALSIYYGYVSNASDMTYWKDNHKLIIKETAKAIAKSLHVEKP